MDNALKTILEQTRKLNAFKTLDPVTYQKELSDGNQK
eukprot:CAMPEP_0116896346 /NCGR_PEP_ID=MMETSP0467-20121206/5609_1 /TAXON_ID=283647 /ORGANISM="Mesodinium pulex, Strain SPMC105" /LENGTH=36 /DNA_ID= /DNA_START= /DNA_END= /DNA_ORIENTATION=